MRDIEALDDSEHLLLRPTMYVGSVEPLQDKVIVYDFEQGYMVQKNKTISEGLYRIFDEVLDNAFDEAKRCFVEKYDCSEIIIEIDSNKNLVKITDKGRGFIKGSSINQKTGISNIETALTRLRAGSNFRNQDFDASIIGMNGIGVSATNILSDYFSIETHTHDETYKQEWNQFVCVSQETIKEKNVNTFTRIEFIPRKTIFKKLKWDFEILYTKLLLKKFQIQNDDALKNINLKFIYDNNDIDLSINIIPDSAVEVNLNKRLKIFLWEATADDMAKMSFVNSSLCVGFHQTFIEEFINEKLFKKEIAHYFYRSLIIMNLKPKDVQFQEQNKTRFVTSRVMMEQVVPLKLKSFEAENIKKTDFYNNVTARIKAYEDKNIINKIKKVKKAGFKVSDKYFAAKESKNLMICEGLSALGGLNQKRNPKTDAIYALRGKIKNVRTLQDISNNAVILDLINIIGLKIEDKGQSCNFDKIILAADFDFDGSHITALLINFFYRWFPKLVQNGKLFILVTPLISYTIDKKINYEYTLEDLKLPKNAKNVRYLKGLGSLSIEDWENVFKDMSLCKVIPDAYSMKHLDIGFSDDIKKRKRWLLTGVQA
jgi:DNA gyrase/topoisomerase IV subunit B